MDDSFFTPTMVMGETGREIWGVYPIVLLLSRGRVRLPTLRMSSELLVLVYLFTDCCSLDLDLLLENSPY
jgi:hypothetical protein